MRETINAVLLSEGNTSIIEEITYFMEDKGKLLVRETIKNSQSDIILML